MKIYLLYEDYGDGEAVVGIYSSKEKAIAAREEAAGEHRYWFFIDEYTIDNHKTYDKERVA